MEFTIDDGIAYICCNCPSIKMDGEYVRFPYDDFNNMINNFENLNIKISHGYCKPCTLEELTKFEK